MIAEEDPSAAFIITIIGAIFALFGWLIVSLAGVMISSYPESSVSWFGVVWAIVGIIGSVLGFLAAFWMRNPEKVHSEEYWLFSGKICNFTTTATELGGE